MYDDFTKATAGTAIASGYVALNAADRIIDALVAKGILTPGEAAALLRAIAQDTREDAVETSADEPASVLSAWLDENARAFDELGTPGRAASKDQRPKLKLVHRDEDD
jgi:polyhydroxyalkanoate synthesis regulator phasin